MLSRKQQAINKDKNVRLVIELDEKVGYYLYVYDLNTGECLQDWLYFYDELEGLYNHTMKFGISKEQFYPI